MPSTAATAVFRLGARPLGPDAGATSPEVTLKTVWRREDFLGSGAIWVGGGGGGGTEKSARSWGSVSRISVVISWLERRALVKI